METPEMPKIDISKLDDKNLVICAVTLIVLVGMFVDLTAEQVQLMSVGITGLFAVARGASK